MTALQVMLDAVTARAQVWPLVFTVRETQAGHIGVAIPSVGIPQAHLACRDCGQSVICLSPDLGAPDGYQVAPGQITASAAAHIRQCHDS